MEGICIMLGITPKIVKVGNVKKPDYWDKSKKLLSKYRELIEQLSNYDKDNIDPGTITKI